MTTIGGSVVEAEISTGRVLQRLKVPTNAAVYSTCMFDTTLYLGMEDGRVREVDMGADRRLGRVMCARQDAIMCLSVSKVSESS